MKKITALLLFTSLFFTTAACSGGNGTTSATTPDSTPISTPASTTTSPPASTTAPTPDTQPEPTDFTIDSNFVVVYPASATESEKAAADTVVAAMTKLGVTLTSQDDSSATVLNEILIGNTSRDASQTAINGITEGGFTLSVSGSTDDGYKIALAANSDVGVELAAKYFVSTYITNKKSATLPLSLTFSHKQRDVKLAGIPLSEYTVVYAKEGVGSSKDIQAAKYADTVTELIDLLEKATGVRLTAIPDTQALPNGSRALLFGNTSLTDDNTIYTTKFASMGVGAYATRLFPSGNVALAGTNACSALAAGEAFVNALLGESEELTKLELYGDKDLIHVACVGDSITYGSTSTDPSMQNYPVYLQRMLGYNYYVEKYGAPGHSLIETDTNSFLNHEYFKKSTSAAPDVVIIMLGTNDCRSQKYQDSAFKNWSDPARKEAFLAAGQKLVDAYRAKNKDVQIIFSTCPNVPQDAWLGSDWTMRILTYGNPAIKTIAKKNNCPVIDIYTYSRNHPEMFDGGDGLHPKDEKYEILAQGVYELTQDIIKK